MKFGEMEIHTSFDDKGGMTETEKKGGVFGTGSERLTVTDKDGGKIETEKTKGLFGSESERLTITTEDMEAIQKFEDAESNKLDDAVEQSSNPEKGKSFKKALKAMTVGVVMLTSTLGGISTAKAENINTNEEDATETTLLSTKAQYDKEEARLIAAIEETRAQHEITEKYNNNLRQKIAQMQGEINQMKERVQTWEERAEDIQLDINNVSKEYDNQQAELARIQEDVSEARQKYISEAMKSMKENYDLDGQIRFLEKASEELEKQANLLSEIDQSIKL